jgi:integrase/recombinase XerD
MRFKEDKPLKEAFSVAELHQLVSDKFREDRYWLHFVLMFYTGCRHREALHLRWQDIVWDQNKIEIRLQDCYQLKRNKERKIPLLSELREVLFPIAKPSGFIIESAVERRNVDGGAFKRYLSRCGIEPRKRSPHSTRHSWVALMLATDINSLQVASWAGHESVAVTAGYAKAQSDYRDSVAQWPKGEFRLRNAAQTATISTA